MFHGLGKFMKFLEENNFKMLLLENCRFLVMTVQKWSDLVNEHSKANFEHITYRSGRRQLVSSVFVHFK